jgi:hypothetical protein
MTAFPTYSSGTVAIGASATTVVGTGSNWTGQNAMPGDTLVVAGFGPVEISDVTDALHLAIDAWPYAAVTAGTTYSIKKDSPLRFVGAQTAVAVDQMVTALNTNGLYVFVGPDLSVPDPSLGEDEQYALQATTGKLWQKTGGIWNFVATYKGFTEPRPWDAVTTWEPFDVASDAGTSYVAILENTNQQPPNATYWVVLAAKGDKGDKGDTGAVPLKPIAAWVTGTGYVAGPPADFLSQAGSSYEVLINHTAGAFATDLAAGKLGLVAAKGADGTGIGDVVGPSSATDGGLVVFDGTTGKLVKAFDDAAAARAELGSAASATTISGSGLVSGGGDLSANRTLTVTAASKSDQQTGTSAATVVTPAHQQDHPSAAKAWCLNSGASTPASVASFNISSLTDNGAGDSTYNFVVAMASANYAAAALTQSGVPFTTQAAPRNIDIVSRSTSGIRIQTGAWSSTGGAFVDMQCSIAVYGEQ